MANEIHIHYDSGKTLYFLIRNLAGNVNDEVAGDGSFEAYVAANIADYDHALTENGDGGGHYVGSFDTNITTAGRYIIEVFRQVGGSVADGDTFIGSGEIVWNGTAEEYVIDSNGRTDVGTVLGVTPISRANIVSDTETGCDTALSNINLDHLIQVSNTVNDASATSSSFDTALTEVSDDHYNNMTIVFTNNNLAGQARRINDYDGTDKTITVVPAFTEAPADGDAFIIMSASYYVSPSAGALEITYTVKKDDEDTGDPIDGVEVWITTDESGANVVWSGTTDTYGVARESGGSKPFLDAGTYYIWRRKSGYNFTNPDTETFS